MRREHAMQIFEAAIDAVLPSNIVPLHISVDAGFLRIVDKQFALNEIDRLIVLGAGKASAAMAAEVENILGDRIQSGLVVTKQGHTVALNHSRVIEAGHPIPDASSVQATHDMLAIASSAGPRDLVLFLLSGGASSLLADFPPGSSLEEIRLLFSRLLLSGADITEMNCVRKHLSLVKGGQLAKCCAPATVVSLIISDVVGDDASVIGSGPTVPDSTSFRDAVTVLEKYDLFNSLSNALMQWLQRGLRGEVPETPKTGDPIFSRVSNFIIASNRIALEAAAAEAASLGYAVEIRSGNFNEQVETLAGQVVDAAVDYKGTLPACLLWGGESTVAVTGEGRGGRNQHLALCALQYMRDHLSFDYAFPLVLSAGTDGTDGPTDATGAMVDKDTLIVSEMAAISPDDFIQSFDSYSFFELTGGHIITGPTHTNVMDIIISIIE